MRLPRGMWDQAYHCMMSMSVVDRQVLLMRYVDRLTPAEIACVLQADEWDVMDRLRDLTHQVRRVLGLAVPTSSTAAMRVESGQASPARSSA